VEFACMSEWISLVVIPAVLIGEEELMVSTLEISESCAEEHSGSIKGSTQI